jgi:xanthosine utilization system XapX-like protein
MLGDAFPELVSLLGIVCIIVSGLIISFIKKLNEAKHINA